MDLDVQLNQGGGIAHVVVDNTNPDTWVTYPDMTVPFGTDYYDGINAATWQFETAMYGTGGIIELYYGSTVIDTYDAYDPDNVSTAYTKQSRSITLPSVASTDIKIRSKYKKYTYDCTDVEETSPPDDYTIYDASADFSFMGSGVLGHSHFKVHLVSTGSQKSYVTEVVDSNTIKCAHPLFGNLYHPSDLQIRWIGAQYINKSSIMIEIRNGTKARIQKYLGRVQFGYESNYVGDGGDCIPGNTWYIDHTAYDENTDPHGHFYYDSDNWEVTSATFKAYLAYDDVNCYAILADPTDDSTVTGSELTVDGTGLYGGAWQSTTVSLSNLTTDTFYCVFGKYSTTGGGSGDYCSVHSPALYFDITSSTDGAYEFGLQVGRRDTYNPTPIQDSEYSNVDSIIFEGHNYATSDCELRNSSLTLIKASAKTPVWNSTFYFARNSVTSLADGDYITTDATPSDDNYDWAEVVFVVITPDDYFAKAHYTKDRTLYDDEIISTTDATAPTVLTNVTGSGVLEELLGDYNNAEIGFYITIDGGVPTAVQTNRLLTTARYNSSLKIETASSGAVITGTVTMSGTGTGTATGNVSTP